MFVVVSLKPEYGDQAFQINVSGLSFKLGPNLPPVAMHERVWPRYQKSFAAFGHAFVINKVPNPPLPYEVTGRPATAEEQAAEDMKRLNDNEVAQEVSDRLRSQSVPFNLLDPNPVRGMSVPDKKALGTRGTAPADPHAPPEGMAPVRNRKPIVKPIRGKKRASKKVVAKPVTKKGVASRKGTSKKAAENTGTQDAVVAA